MTDGHRPITSKARGVCKYYTTERGCFNANYCKFLHSNEPATDPSGSRAPLLTPYDQAKRCKYYAQGYCKRGDKCWFVHEKSVVDAKEEDQDDDCCSVCFERPSLYGLLGGCNHIFCIDCIRKWRDPSGKGSDISNIKKCPMCRAQCRYIIPSSHFVMDGPEKERIVQNYKDSMARVPCKHFMATKGKNPKKPLCPYGADCFYQHLNDDGTAYTFPYGAEIAMRNWSYYNRNRNRHLFSLLSDGMDPNFGEEADLAGNFAMDIFHRMLSQVMESSLEGRNVGATRTPEETRFRRLLEGDSVLRFEFISALYAARARITGDDSSGDIIRPVNISESMASSNWDLEGDDGDEVDNGWIWNELVADTVENANIDAMEHLELVDSTGSPPIVRRRDTESPVPPLEPISILRQETPPSSEPIGAGGAFQDNDDEMPALQSVSNFSDSEDDEGNADEPGRYADYDPPDNLLHLESVTQPEEEARSSYSRRFSTVVERERGRTDGFEETEASHESTPVASPIEDSEISVVIPDVPTFETTQPVVTPHLESALEPPFVTDGRGRVVWSNKDSTETMTSNETRESREDVQPPSNATRLFEWMTVVNYPMSLPSTSKIKASLTEQLGANAPQYFAAIKFFVTGQTSREEFEKAVRQYLSVPSLVQLHNALIISLFDCTIHRHPPPPIPIPAPVHKQPPLKRRRTGDYNLALRSTRLKRWTLGTGKRERERIRALETAEPPIPHIRTDEISSERGVVLLSERGDPPGSRLPVHLFSISRAPTLAHISDRMNLISAQNNLNAPARNVPSLMNLACEAKLKQLITHALTLTSTSHAISSISPSTSFNHLHRPPAVLSTSAFQTLLTIAPADLPNRSATAIRLALGETDVTDESYDDIALLKDREVRDQRWQIVALLAERSAIRDGLRGVAKGVA
ncbi:putative E3 ubiquitin-protein ligase makorin-1 [Termitomyces sp. T112]|nr:putative E3 ubiquitin-protein ligase makorin-1 [Termitomyces sp. T112]